MANETSGEQVTTGSYTLRGLIEELVRNGQDLDSEVTISIFNSDGIPIKGIDYDSDGDRMVIVAETR